MSGMSHGHNESLAVVTRVEGHHAWIEVNGSAGCGSCSGQNACGTGLLGLRIRPRAYRVRNTIAAKAGDSVRVSVEGGGIFRAAFFAYLLPLGLGLAGAAIASQQFSGSDVAAAVGLLAGLGTGWSLLRWRAEPESVISLQSKNIRMQPRINQES